MTGTEEAGVLPGPVRAWLLVAAVAAVLALAVPGGARTTQLGLGLAPGWCMPSYDLNGWATLSCAPATTTTTIEVVETYGLRLPVRVHAALALAAAVVALRERRRRPPGARPNPAAVVAVAAAVVGVAVGGLSGPSRLLALAATMALAIALLADPHRSSGATASATGRGKRR